MAGGGSISSMIATLRNNARLLRKKSMFKREPSFLNAKKELFKAAEGKIDLRKATPNELKKVRELIAQNKRINRRNFIIAFAVIIPSVILISKLGLDALNDLKPNPNKFKSENELSDHQKKKEMPTCFT